MNDYLHISTPAQKEAGLAASVFGLENHGLTRLHRIYWNLPEAALYEEAVFRGEARLAHMGPLVVNTGKHTARAANDKFRRRFRHVERAAAGQGRALRDMTFDELDALWDAAKADERREAST